MNTEAARFDKETFELITKLMNGDQVEILKEM